MTLPSSDLPPQKVLLPRRKRTLLSFRRKRDVAWFLLSISAFAGGVTGLIITSLRLRTSVPSIESTNSSSGEKRTELPPEEQDPEPTALPSIEEPEEAAAPEPPEPKPATETEKIPAGPAPKGFELVRAGTKFKTSTDRNARLGVTPTVSSGEKAVRLEYDLAEGQWVQSFLEIKEDLSKYKRVQFVFSGGGGANTLEFKIVDSDGSNVGTDWPRATGRPAWTVVDIPLRDLPYLWGGDPKMDWKRVRQIYFNVAKRSGDRGGKGRVTIRGIRFQ